MPLVVHRTLSDDTVTCSSTHSIDCRKRRCRCLSRRNAQVSVDRLCVTAGSRYCYRHILGFSATPIRCVQVLYIYLTGIDWISVTEGQVFLETGTYATLSKVPGLVDRSWRDRCCYCRRY